MTQQIRHPEVHVQLSGEDGNGFAIIGRATRAMERAGVPETEIEEFRSEAMSGDYDHLLRTVMRWVETS